MPICPAYYTIFTFMAFQYDVSFNCSDVVFIVHFCFNINLYCSTGLSLFLGPDTVCGVFCLVLFASLRRTQVYYWKNVEKNLSMLWSDVMLDCSWVIPLYAYCKCRLLGNYYLLLLFLLCLRIIITDCVLPLWWIKMNIILVSCSKPSRNRFARSNPNRFMFGKRNGGTEKS